MTWEISIRGRVQGVGFRPFVWRAALQRNLKGSVANGLQGVVMKINATKQQALDFQYYLVENAPELARITGHSIEPIPEQFFDNFTIEESAHEGLPLLLLPPDVALCNSCRAEIHDPGNRRYGYAFTTCTVCGPRYSILTGVPYDRAYTSMQGFDLCKTCQAEYENPEEHRYYAQTNSCSDCGIQMQFFDFATLIWGGDRIEFRQDLQDGQDLQDLEFFRRKNTVYPNYPVHPVNPVKNKAIANNSSLRQQVIAAWKSGAIVAIKGIGGYLLTCDATNATAVATLRTRKHRPSKPFALMYPDVDTLKGDAEVSEIALLHLQHPSAPILLLDVLELPKSGIDCAGIAPGLCKIGAMLPNAPLFDLLLRDFGKPIVATSGNISHSPLIYEDETALRELSGIADYILTHNRKIVMPQDDSVMSLRKSGKSTLLRRARGLAPAFIQPGLKVPDTTILALGAEMKSAFTLAHIGNLNISQYLGDLEDFETQQRFDTVLQHLLDLFKAQPTLVIGDLHPGYFTTQLGQMLAEKWQVPFFQVQHHKAHFAAVLEENELFKSDSEVLGIIWDGTGFGDDGQIWGGEFFVYDASQTETMQRSGHFEYFPLLLGDKMPREPRLSALSACRGIAEASESLQAKFTDTEWNLYQKLLLQENQLMTSSIGRIFDAVASLLGLADKVSYEGEAALKLEDLGRRFYRQKERRFEAPYPFEIASEGTCFQVKTGNLFQHILSDLENGLSTEYIAAKFHFSMVCLIEKVSNHLKVKKIAFSGGVFQNTLLLDMIERHFSPDYQLYFHQQLSPNDENISFGQWAYYQSTNHQ